MPIKAYKIFLNDLKNSLTQGTSKGYIFFIYFSFNDFTNNCLNILVIFLAGLYLVAATFYRMIVSSCMQITQEAVDFPGMLISQLRLSTDFVSLFYLWKLLTEEFCAHQIG